MAETEIKLPVLASIPMLKPYTSEPNSAKGLFKNILRLILRRNNQGRILSVSMMSNLAKEAFQLSEPTYALGMQCRDWYNPHHQFVAT